MAQRFTRRHLAGLCAIAAVGLVGILAAYVLAVPAGADVLVIRTAGLPDISHHPKPSRRPESGTAVWLVREGTGWLAFSNRSPHPRGCEVRWVAEEQKFVEPCLGQIFDRTGLNVGGPAPRGLDAYPVRVKGPDTVEVDLSHPRPVSGGP